MDDFWTVILLSIAMLIGCYLAGSIPLAVSFSEEKLKLVTVLGAGLLVGTALSVIIPEGVHTLYETRKQAFHLHEAAAAASNPLVKKDVKADDHGLTHSHDHNDADLHSVIGVALVLGFVFMLLVDQIGGGSHSHHVSDSETGTTIQSRSKMTATIGLVVHAAADGVALGAAASMSQAHVTMIVFIAIMLHKAPAAFGLVTFLLHDNFERNRIRRHLLVFSLAAPVLALITFFCLGQQSQETLSNINATGIAMLFSAGTFLYVSTVHVLPEIASMGSQPTTVNGTVIIREHKGFTWLELTLLVIGSLVPVLLSLGHHH
ncbi:zinc transporter ZIP9-A-like [Lineus longissimus]|uniref:zinc transporter ZIP9-A-like n=1 Tax=Lineus longissimus TaxID=88925 RepID=UPI002B4D568A